MSLATILFPLPTSLLLFTPPFFPTFSSLTSYSPLFPFQCNTNLLTLKRTTGTYQATYLSSDRPTYQQPTIYLGFSVVSNFNKVGISLRLKSRMRLYPNKGQPEGMLPRFVLIFWVTFIIILLAVKSGWSIFKKALSKEYIFIEWGRVDIRWGE